MNNNFGGQFLFSVVIIKCCQKYIYAFFVTLQNRFLRKHFHFELKMRTFLWHLLYIIY